MKTYEGKGFIWETLSWYVTRFVWGWSDELAVSEICRRIQVDGKGWGYRA